MTLFGCWLCRGFRGMRITTESGLCQARRRITCCRALRTHLHPFSSHMNSDFLTPQVTSTRQADDLWLLAVQGFQGRAPPLGVGLHSMPSHRALFALSILLAIYVAVYSSFSFTTVAPPQVRYRVRLTNIELTIVGDYDAALLRPLRSQQAFRSSLVQTRLAAVRPLSFRLWEKLGSLIEEKYVTLSFISTKYQTAESLPDWNTCVRTVSDYFVMTLCCSIQIVSDAQTHLASLTCQCSCQRTMFMAVSLLSFAYCGALLKCEDPGACLPWDICARKSPISSTCQWNHVSCCHCFFTTLWKRVEDSTDDEDDGSSLEDSSFDALTVSVLQGFQVLL
jgi:hypothetical protein